MNELSAAKQRRIAQHLANGSSSRKTACAVGVSKNTVNRYRRLLNLGYDIEEETRHQSQGKTPFDFRAWLLQTIAKTEQEIARQERESNRTWSEYERLCAAFNAYDADRSSSGE